MHRPNKPIVTLAVSLAGVLAMAGVAAAAHGSRPSLRPATSRHHDESTTTLAEATTTTAPDLVPEPGDDNGNDTTTTVAGDATTTTTVEAAPEAGDDHGAEVAGEDPGEHGGDASESGSGDVTTTTTAIPNGMQTFTVTGGTVTVDVENGVLSLVSAIPNAGFTIDNQESSGDRVEVEFRGNDVQSRVRVRVEDGQLRVETGDN